MKKKKRLSERLPSSQFILLFTIIHGLILGIAFGFLPLVLNIEALLPYWGIFSILLGIIPTLLTYYIQGLLFKFQFNWSATKWFQASFIGLMGFYVWTMLTSYVPDASSTGTLISGLRGLAILPIAIAQYIVLRQYVRRSYLWIVALLLNALMVVPLYRVSNTFSALIDSTTLNNILSITFVYSATAFFLAVMMTLIVRLSMADQQQISHTQQDADEDTKHLEDQHNIDEQFIHDEATSLQQYHSS